MKDYQLTSDLRAGGMSPADVRHLTATHELERLRRGAYLRQVELPQDFDAESRHRLLIESTVDFGIRDSVVSFGSAAVIHQLPVWPGAIDKVHLTRNRPAGGRIRDGVHVHVANLAPADLTDIAQLTVTSLPRTFVDHARTTSLAQGVAAGDRALRLGMDLTAVAEQLESAKARLGIGRARQAARLIDASSESPGESFSRVLFVQGGLPIPELQVELTPDARVDFFWPDLGVIGEFDGKIKYGKYLRPGETASDAVFREKQREDRLRDLGYIVVRWVWDDLRQAPILIARIRHAFERGGVRI